MKNSFNKVLSFMLALVMIVGCFSVITVSAADCNHNPETDKVVKEEKATCGKAGYTVYECAACGGYTVRTEKSETHTGLVEVPAADPTCTSPAMTAGVYCTDCNDMTGPDGKVLWGSEENPVGVYAYLKKNPTDTAIVMAKAVEGSKKLGHDFKYFDYITGNCASADFSWFQCSRCGEFPASDDAEHPYKELRPAGDHQYTIAEVVVKGDTCVDAVTKFTCRVCGDVQTVTSEAPHKWEDLDGVDNTCGEYEAGQRCSLCNKERGAKLRPDSAKKHDATPAKNVWSTPAIKDALIKAGYKTDKSLSKAHTCTVDGMTVMYCEDCGAIWEEVLDSDKAAHLDPKSGEFYLDYDKKVSCSPEYAYVTYCGECCNFRAASTTFDHDGESNTPAVACYKGTYLTKVTYIAAVTHKFETLTTEDVQTVTCDDALETWKKCEHCGYETTKESYGVKAHVWGDFKTTGDCINGWYKNKECLVCGDDYYTANDDKNLVKAGNAVAHIKGNPQSWIDVVVIPGTCVTNSYSADACRECGLIVAEPTEIKDSKDAANHVKIVLDRTGNAGTTIKYATIAQLGFVDENYVGAYAYYTAQAGGDWTKEKIGVTAYPTCEKNGSANIYCACKAVVKADILADGHDEVGGDRIVWLNANGEVIFYSANTNNDTPVMKWNASTQQFAESGKTYSQRNDAGVGSAAKSINLKFVSPTCTADGYTLAIACTRCAKIHGGHTVIDNDNVIFTEFGTPGANIDKASVTAQFVQNDANPSIAPIKGTITLKQYHTGLLDASIDVVAPTCSTEGYTEIYCSSCCGSDPSNKIKINVVDPIATGHVEKTVEASTASCSKAGNYEYTYCEVCKAVLDIITCTEHEESACTDPVHKLAQYTLNPSIEKTGHTFEVENGATFVDEQKPDCINPGYTAHTICKDCNAKSATYSVIPATGHEMVDFVKTKTDCTVNGIYLANGKYEKDLNNGQYCKKCLTNGKTTNLNDDVVVIDPMYHDPRYSNYSFVAINGADDTIVSVSITNDCTGVAVEGSNTITRCTKCGELKVPFNMITYSTRTEHQWNPDEQKYTVDEDTNKILNPDKSEYKGAYIYAIGGYQYPNGVFACEADKHPVNYVKCVNCEATKSTGNKCEDFLPNHHYVDADVDVVIDLDCTKAEIGVTCLTCNKTVTDKYALKDTAGYLFVNHKNLVESQKDPECEEDGYHTIFCTACNELVVNEGNELDEYKALGSHDIKALDLVNNFVYAKVLTDITGLTLNVDYFVYDNVNYAYQWALVEKIAPTTTSEGTYYYFCGVCGEKQAHTVPASKGLVLDFVPTANGTESVTVDVIASATDFEFNYFTFTITAENGLVPVKKVVLNNKAFDAAANVSAKAEIANNAITVTVSVPKNLDGKDTNTKLTADKTVIATVTFAQTLTATTSTTLTAACGAAKYINDNGQSTDCEGYAIYTAPAGEKTALQKFVPNVVGDANGDNEINGTDAAVLTGLAYTGVFNASLDFNNDGIVDIADYVAVSKFLASAQTQADYLVLIGVDYLAIVNAVDQFDMRDLNGDTKIDDTDREILRRYVASELQKKDMSDRNSFLSVDAIIAARFAAAQD